MAALGRRLAMAAVGTVLLTFYLAAGSLVYLGLVALWRIRPDPVPALLVVLGTALAFGVLSYKFGTARLLSSLDAVDLPRERAPTAHRRLDRLVESMDVERPRLLIADMAAPNALAVGSGGNGALVVDRRLFRLLDGDELAALFAHELAHLEGRDSLVQSLAFGLGRTVVGAALLLVAPVVWVVGGVARAVAWLAGRPSAWPENPLGRLQRRLEQVVLLLLVVVTVAVLAHSRRREYAADDRAAEVTGDPLALARALVKIDRAAQPGWGLLSPLYTHREDEEGPLGRLLSSHPPLDERVDRLADRADADARRVRPA